MIRDFEYGILKPLQRLSIAGERTRVSREAVEKYRIQNLSLVDIKDFL